MKAKTSWGPTTDVPPETTVCLEINLAQIRENYEVLAGLSTGECGAVVKADAYGLGAGPVSKTLFAAGCRDFFVTNLAEGISLRQKDGLPSEARVFVFNGVPEGTEALFEAFCLVPVLISLKQIKRWADFATLREKKLPAAVHIDTGMCRTGLSEEEQRVLREQPERLRPLQLHFLLSHLASHRADERNGQQLRRFSDFARDFPNVKRTVAASMGMMFGGEFHLDLTRPGLAIYAESPHFPPQCKLPVGLWAKIIQIRRVEEGEEVGYGSTYRCRSHTRLAVVNVGFADLWARPSDGEIGMAVRGQRVPLRGKPSMDLLVADISSLPEGSVAEGDWVELLGPSVPLHDAARLSATTPAHVLCSLRKVQAYRVYLHSC